MTSAASNDDASDSAPVTNSQSAGPSEETVWHKVYLHMEKARIKPIALFRSIDADENGTISAQELRAGLKRIVNIDLTDDEFKAVLKFADKDRSNDISYKELSRAIKYGNPERKAKIKAIQKRNTSNGNKKRKSPAPRSPASPTPSNMSSASTLTLTNFKVPTGIASIDREGFKQEQFMQALLVPSRVRRKSNRAREQMLRDFSISSTQSSTMASTIELAGPALRKSNFCRSPTNRDNPNPDLAGADTPVDPEHVRAERSRRRAERAKAADENWCGSRKKLRKLPIAPPKKEREKAKALRGQKTCGKGSIRSVEAERKSGGKRSAKKPRARQRKGKTGGSENERRSVRGKAAKPLAKIHAQQAKADAAVSQEVEAIEALARRRNRELKKKLKKLLSTPYTDPTTLSLIRGRTPGGSQKKDKLAPAWLLPPNVAKVAGLQSTGSSSIKDVSPPPAGSTAKKRNRRKTGRQGVNSKNTDTIQGCPHRVNPCRKCPPVEERDGAAYLWHRS